MDSQRRIFIGLAAVGVTQPVLDALQRNEPFRHTLGVSPEVVSLFAWGLSLTVTLGVLLLEFVSRCGPVRLRGVVRTVVLLTLLLIATLATLRPLLNSAFLREHRLTWVVSISLSAGLAAGLLAGLRRLHFLRQWMIWLAGGSLLFPAALMLGIYRESSARQSTAQPMVARSPFNIVMVVFDEFSGLTLMDHQLQIDAERFPGFAELGRSATWYRRGTSVNARTGTAIPAILTGVNPTQDPPSTRESWPDNLFSILERTGQYEQTTFEPVTRLGLIEKSKPLFGQSFTSGMQTLIATLAKAYPRLLLPSDTPAELPDLPVQWHGFVQNRQPLRNMQNGRISYTWSEERSQQLQHCLETLTEREKPHLWFFHLGLPHFPWCYLPDGTAYLADDEAEWPPPQGLGNLGEDWAKMPSEVLRCEYRYRLQVGYVDRWISQLIDRLKSQNLWDETLLIVVGDHGVAFQPGHSRRKPEGANLAELMSVPMFVKWPRQMAGSVDDSNVESIDLFPSILETIGLEPPVPVDGNSLIQTERRPRKMFRCEGTEVAISGDFRILDHSLQLQSTRWGALPLTVPPAGMASRPEFLNRPVSSFRITSNISQQVTFSRGAFPGSSPAGQSEFRNALIQGTIPVENTPESPCEIALALNGMVIDVCHLQPTGAYQLQFHLFAPAIYQTGTPASLDLYLFRSRDPMNWSHLHHATISDLPPES